MLACLSLLFVKTSHQRNDGRLGAILGNLLHLQVNDFIKKGFKAPSYIKAVRVYARKFQDFFGDTDIRDIGAKKIEECYLSLNGAPKYIKNILEIDAPGADIKTIDLDLQDSIISIISHQMDRTFILFSARLTLRPCEPRALYWEDVDFKYHRVTIKRHYSLHSSATEPADREGVDVAQEFLYPTKRATTKKYVKQNPERLSPSIHKFDNEFIHSGFSAE